MFNTGYEQGRKAVNLEIRTEEILELASEEEATFFAFGKCKDYDKFGCAASFKASPGNFTYCCTTNLLSNAYNRNLLFAPLATLVCL